MKGFTSEGDVEVDYGGDIIILVKAAVCKVLRNIHYILSAITIIQFCKVH